MGAPTHADGMLFMEYYKLWDTPFDNEAWTAVRRLRAAGAFDSYERFRELVPRSSADFGLVDRVFCAFGQAGVLMKHGLLHPDLYFEGWADVTRVWAAAEAVVHGMREETGSQMLYCTFEWLAQRNAEWTAERAATAPPGDRPPGEGLASDMTSPVTTDTLKALLAAFNRHDLDDVMSFFGEDPVLEMPRGQQPWGSRAQGQDEVRAQLATRFSGLPDVRYSEDRHLVCGDRGVSEWLLTGTTPDGRSLRVRGCDLFEFADGKVSRKDSYWKIVE